MASKQVEREIDEWVDSCPLRRRSITNRRRVMKNSKHYDGLWKQCLKDMEREHEEEKLIQAFRNS